MSELYNSRNVVEQELSHLKEKRNAYTSIGKQVFRGVVEDIAVKQLFSELITRTEHEIVALEYVLNKLSTPTFVETEFYPERIRVVLDELKLTKRCCRAFVVARTRVNECSVCHAKIDMSVYDTYDSKIPVMRK